MVLRVATDEGPLQTPSSDESGLGRSDSPSDESEPEPALVVPPDGGWGWVVVAASFICNSIVDGITFSSSSLLDGMKKTFQINDTAVAPVTSLLTGFYLLAGPFVSALANKYGFRKVTIMGSIIASASFAVSFYAPNVAFLYIIYGVIGGIGFCMVYMPAVVIVGFYFEKWRALATGLALCGSGIGTFVLGPLNEYLIKHYDWRSVLLFHAGFVLLCTIAGAFFRPLTPVTVTLAEQTEEEISNKRHEEAVEKLNSMLKLQGNLNSGRISMPPEMKFTNKASPHTWMGVANNTRYPTAEEVFRGSNSHLNRRSSINTSNMRNKPMFITVPVAEKDEQEDSNGNIDNTEPLLTSAIKVVPSAARYRRSQIDLIARPMYRDDIFFGASLTRLPQYTSRSSLAYHLAVTHVPTKEEAQEERSEKCRLCPEAVRRILATMLDVSLLKSPTVMLLAVSGFFTMLGYAIPFLYLPLKAEMHNVPQSTRGLYVSAIGIANVIGRITCGILTSTTRLSPLWLNNIAISAGGVAVMLSTVSNADFCQFGCCVVFGLAIACFASLRSILVVEYLGLEQLTNCFGLFLLFQGLGAMFGPLIAGALKDMTNNYDASFYAAGVFILISALICYPIDYVSKWEKSRNKTQPKV